MVLCPGVNIVSRAVCNCRVALGWVCCPYCYSDYFYSREGLVNVMQSRMMATLPADASIDALIREARAEAYGVHRAQTDQALWMRTIVRTACKHWQRWRTDRQYRLEKSRMGWLPDSKGVRTEPWTAEGPYDWPPTTGYMQRDSDALVTIARIVIGHAEHKVLDRNTQEYRDALCNMYYARQVPNYMRDWFLPWAQPGADRALIVLNLVHRMSTLGDDDPVLRGVYGRTIDPSAEWQSRFFDALAGWRARAGGFFANF